MFFTSQIKEQSFAILLKFSKHKGPPPIAVDEQVPLAGVVGVETVTSFVMYAVPWHIRNTQVCSDQTPFIKPDVF
ncbi:MAG TPA: hypothetical protein DCS07_05535 [Bdellovibrionales bacterium]|nr:hypothetical protein [Bdellovibrionales bacterium]